MMQCDHYTTAVDLVVGVRVIRAEAFIITIVGDELLMSVVLLVVDHLINVFVMIEPELSAVSLLVSFDLTDSFACFNHFSCITNHFSSSELVVSKAYHSEMLTVVIMNFS